MAGMNCAISEAPLWERFFLNGLNLTTKLPIAEEGTGNDKNW